MARCLAAGSMIRTPLGEVAVEDISSSAEIVGIRGGLETIESVLWIGSRSIDLARHAYPEQVAPVRIRTGAIADHQPSRDLLVSPEHAIFIEGLLIQAGALVNGGSIVQERAMNSVTYFHIELKSHGVFFANDLLVESYLDNGDRTFFEMDGQPMTLHPSLTPRTNFDARTTDACYAPFTTDLATVEPIWRKIAQRSQDLGYVHPIQATTTDANLHILADGKVIRPTMDGNCRYVFVLPAGVSSACLISRFAIPNDSLPYANDARRLGVAVTTITIQSQGTEVVVPADLPTNGQGWHDVEHSDAAVWRWTNGAATLPLGHMKAASVITIVGRTLDCYPIDNEFAHTVKKVA